VIYAFMTTSLLISVPYTQINEDAAFAAAMETIGYPWWVAATPHPPSARAQQRACLCVPAPAPQNNCTLLHSHST
jgi:hypothetical protein